MGIGILDDEDQDVVSDNILISINRKTMCILNSILLKSLIVLPRLEATKACTMVLRSLNCTELYNRGLLRSIHQDGCKGVFSYTVKDSEVPIDAHLTCKHYVFRNLLMVKPVDLLLSSLQKVC